MTITIAHFSDIHYSDETLAEVDRCFNFAVDEAVRRDVRLAVITGDATDHAVGAHSPAYAALAKNVRRLADQCPVLMLQGTYSHEPEGTLDLFRLLGGRHPVHVADRLGQVALTTGGAWLASPGWRFSELPGDIALLCSCVPTINKAVVAAGVGAGHAAEAVGEQLAALLAGFAGINGRARKAGIPTICLSHGTVHGCLTEHGVPMAGMDHEFTAGTLFSAGASAFMLGHIHKHQAWDESGRMIAYPGSCGRLHYGELGQKGFLCWDVDAAGARYDFVETPARRMLDLDFGGMPDMEALRRFVDEGIEGAWVRVRWSFPEEERDGVDRKQIQAMLQGAAGIKLEGTMIPVVRTRAAGISRERSLEAKVARWARVVAADSAPLLECARAIQNEGPDAIAARILAEPDRDAAKEGQVAAHEEVAAEGSLDAGGEVEQLRLEAIPAMDDMSTN